jgi:hypothetical protein
MATISANTYYQCSEQKLGSFSGGTWEASLGPAPHPINYRQETPGDSTSQINTVIDFSSITIGGFSGLNS